MIGILLFAGQQPPAMLDKLKLPVRHFSADSIPDLDPSSTGWVSLLPVEILLEPLWHKLRVRLTQSNRAFIVFGQNKDSLPIVEAMRDGAFDFIFHDEPLPRWLAALEKAAESQALWFQLYGRASDTTQLLVGKSPAILSLIKTIKRIGPTAANVLITGESGTGKEKVALALHQSSGLKGPFLPINCAAIPRDLIEAELFGAEKGSYTGALQPRVGLVEQAAGGTLFLDEIGELDISLQPKLLRFLESRRARRVGGKGEYAADARILAATNRDLELQIDQNIFRADLYYRLSEIALKLAPLRNHIEDIPVLAMHFLNEANERFGKNFVSLEPALISSLMTHTWPGNARELRAAIHHMAVLHDGPVLRGTWWAKPESHLPQAPAQALTSSVVNSPLPLHPNRRQKWERARSLLEESGNDRTWVAAQLGIHPTTLFRWSKSGKL